MPVPEKRFHDYKTWGIEEGGQLLFSVILFIRLFLSHFSLSKQVPLHAVFPARNTFTLFLHLTHSHLSSENYIKRHLACNHFPDPSRTPLLPSLFTPLLAHVPCFPTAPPSWPDQYGQAIFSPSLFLPSTSTLPGAITKGWNVLFSFHMPTAAIFVSNPSAHVKGSSKQDSWCHPSQQTTLNSYSHSYPQKHRLTYWNTPFFPPTDFNLASP